MPENCQAATTPIVLTVSSPSARGRPFPRMEPGFQFPQELIDTTGQPDKLLIFGPAVKWFHLLDEYTSYACLDDHGSGRDGSHLAAPRSEPDVRN